MGSRQNGWDLDQNLRIVQMDDVAMRHAWAAGKMDGTLTRIGASYKWMTLQ
jgi:hypothetical protein